MPTNSKSSKGLGKALIDAVGLLSFLFGSLILLAIVFGAIGGIFMSTKRLFQVKRAKKDEDKYPWRTGTEERSKGGVLGHGDTSESLSDEEKIMGDYYSGKD